MPRLIFKDLFRYVALPEVMPRLRTLLFGGFGYIPFFIAVVYQMVGLLPRNHPYIMQRNIGRFGIRHVLAEAANNITFSLKNIDQIVLYVAVLAGIIIFLIQLLALGSIFILQPAVALPVNFSGFFVVPAANRPHDISYMMLDMVFGVPHPSLLNTGFFESCVSTNTVCQQSDGTNFTAMNTVFFVSFIPAFSDQMGPFSPQGFTYFPFPFHDGLHKIFGFYSSGLMIIAVIMTAYFVVTVIGETTQTGTPFGKRFNKTWAPLRIVIAFGLLMPLTVGLNSAQYIVLYSAKWGSAFATNGWTYFNVALSTSYTGNFQRLVSMPNMPDLNEFVQYMFVARTCKYITDHYMLTELREKENREGLPLSAALPLADRIHPYVLKEDTAPINAMLLTELGHTYQSVVDWVPVNTVKIKIRFGVRDEDKFSDFHSSVKPICGDIIFSLIDGRRFADQEPYMRDMQEAYYNLFRDLWWGALWDGVAGGAGYPAYQRLPSLNHRYRYYADRYVKGLPGAGVNPADHNVKLDSVYVQNMNDIARATIETASQAAILLAQTSTLWGGPYNGTAASADPLYSRGWAAAGVWYNRIAQVNGQLTDAVANVPVVVSYPMIMETVSDKKSLFVNMHSVEEQYKPEAPAIDDMSLLLDSAHGLEYATALYNAHKAWVKAASAQSQHPRGNPILTFISYLLGLDGLYNMRDNAANATHPLAQLSGVGRSLVESSIRSLGYAAASSMVSAMGPVPKQLMYVISSFFITVAMLGLTVGFVLFYILPFLPFIYFFFAVGGWVKGIFEAMVGAPLWALAHIRIDGHGMPGNAAMNGYFLIFEVFLRPILIVFGMLASISIFSALVNVLNSIFDLVMENTAGYDITSQIADASFTGEYMRSLIDQFFFTVIYTLIVYMIGMSSFKLIDLIPNNILRWMGQSVATFGDTREDPAQGLVSRASIGSQQVLGKIGGGLGGMAKAAAGS
ncbi:MAG: DotA/TraY family protein [Alphaproteobacteria bacterium]|nr:DotA/TraY family protein [Alphaproteobacteria bacterium]